MTTDPFDRAVSADRSRKVARLRAAELMGLRIHAAVYVTVQLLLVAIWWLTGGGYQWFWFVVFGWGIGLAAHAAVVYRPRTPKGQP